MIFPDFSLTFPVCSKFPDFSLTGKCLPIFPGFPGFPVRVGTLHLLWIEETFLDGFGNELFKFQCLNCVNNIVGIDNIDFLNLSTISLWPYPITRLNSINLFISSSHSSTVLVWLKEPLHEPVIERFIWALAHWFCSHFRVHSGQHFSRALIEDQWHGSSATNLLRTLKPSLRGKFH